MLMSYLWQILVPGLTVCVAIVGTAGLLAFACRRAGWCLGGMSEGQTLLLASVCVLALLLNANAWLPGRILFPALLATGMTGLVMAAWGWRRAPMAHVVLWVAATGWLCTSVMVAAWDLAFAGRHLWMLEGTNHDLVFFYGGAKWALQYPLAVDQAAVQQTWELGRCGQGMQFIGSGCIVQRNGAYTLLGLASTLVPEAGPNQTRAMVGAYAVFPLLGLLPVIGRRFGQGRWWPHGGMLTSALVLLCMGCTGMLLAVVNENIGAAMAAALLTTIVLWGLTPMASLPVKWIMLGMTAGCVGIVYGEAAVYACVIVALAVVVTARWQRSWRTLAVGGVLSLLTCALVLNRYLPELIASYQQVSGIVAQADWPSWYIHQFPLWWLGAPFAGLLMTAQPPVNPEAVAMGVLLMLVTACLAVRERRGRFFCGLLLVSGLLVGYVQLQGYEYGEHKLVQMLGPVWVALLAWVLARHARRRRTLPTILLVAGVLAALSSAYATRARAIIESHVPAAVTYSLAAALRLPQPGDEVILDTAAVRGPEKFVKQDFAILELHQRGVRARLAASGNTPEGYSDALFEGSLAAAHSPDWLLVLKQPGTDSVTHPPMAPVREDATFALYSLNHGEFPSVVAGKGWHQCEQQHCWTSGEFTVEAVVPSACENPLLYLAMAPFQPPAGGRIEVKVNGADFANLHVEHNQEILVPLALGRSVVSVHPRWQVQSPHALGMSDDGRRLFASISTVGVRCG